MMTPSKPHVVVFSTLFPSRSQPQAGIFIRERMFRVAGFLPVTVVAPQPWLPLQGLLRLWKPGFRPVAPAKEIQSGIEVLRPRFLSFPGMLKRWDGLFLAMASFATLRKLKRAGRLDVLDAHFAYPEGYAAALLGRWLRVPVTLTLRGTEARHARDRVLRPKVVQALQGASRIFAVAQSLKKIALSLGIPDSAVRVVGNGVDTARFHAVPKEAARAQLGLPPDAPVLISVGGLVERKGFHRVIECLPALLERFPGLQYLVVGGASAEGDMSKELAAQVARLGLQRNVRFLGALAQDEIKVPLSAADVFVLATRNEGWANVFLEAMACRLPVVTTDVGGNAEVVCRPELGTLVAFGDAAALQRALERALAARWDRAAIAAYARQNSWDDRVSALVQEFRDLPAGGKTVSKSAYTALVSGALFPLHELVKRHDSVRVRRTLEASQWWDAQRISALQLERLRALLAHAGQHVPHYRDLFGRLGFSSTDIRSLADLADLPLLAKPEIRANLERLKSERAQGLMRFNTGGSTGEPLIFWLGRERVSHDVAAKWRATRWWGVDIGDPEVVVWGSPIELGAQDRVRALRDALLRTELLPAFQMSEAGLDGFLARIRARRPKMLFGYPSALAHIARHARRRGVAMNDLGIRVAFVTSETLYGDQRLDIEGVFGCPVANGYGSREAGFIAHECPAGGMHITAEDFIVEIVDERGRPLPVGRSGEIVVTHLATGDFPFIRYRTGDVGTLSDRGCACGRGLPLLAELQGRTTDFVVAEDGTVMHGLALIYVIRGIRGIRQYKIIQESLDTTRVLLVTDPGFNAWDEDAIRKGFAQRLGSGVRIDIERVAEIPREASGKYRYIVSHVKTAPQPRVMEPA